MSSRSESTRLLELAKEFIMSKLGNEFMWNRMDAKSTT